MKTNNKCFFSISIENGITITGENPNKVIEFLMDCYSAFVDSAEQSKKEGFKFFAERCIEHRNAMLNAAHTIKEHMKGE